MLKKSPAGSIFPYYYKDGELLGLHYGSFFGDEPGLLQRMQGEEAFIASTIPSTPVWIDFYQSKLTDKILLEFVGSIQRLESRITRLAVVGCSFRDKARLRKLIRKPEYTISIPLRFFNDPERAKTWLVSEGFRSLH
jgi:hypothetical protein